MHFFNQPVRTLVTDSTSAQAANVETAIVDLPSAASVSGDLTSVESTSGDAASVEAISLIDDKTVTKVRTIVAKAIGKKFLKVQDGDEIVQEILIRLWEKKDRFDSARSSWSTFCGLIARNTIAEHHRNRGSKRKLEFQSLDICDQPEGEGVFREFTESDKPSSRTGNRRNADQFAELQTEIAAAKSGLPEPLRHVCTAIENCDSFESAAKQLGITSATLRRRREKLRELLADSPLSQEV